MRRIGFIVIASLALGVSAVTWAQTKPADVKLPATKPLTTAEEWVGKLKASETAGDAPGRVLVGPTVQPPAAKPPAVTPLTETERLLIENHTLRFRLMLQAMSAERADLTKRILASRPGAEIDWDKLELKPAERPAPGVTPKQ